MQLKFYDAVINDTLDLGAPIIDAMANNHVVKTNYDGDHYQGKDGNIWDHLVDNNPSEGGSSNNNGSSNTDSNTSGQTGNNNNNNGSSGSGSSGQT